MKERKCERDPCGGEEIERGVERERERERDMTLSKS